MNYSDIKTAVKAYSDRSDIDLILDTFTQVLESRINTVLKVNDMSVRTVANLSSTKTYYGLPDDFLAMRDIEVYPSGNVDNKITLDYIAPGVMNEYIRKGYQNFYTIIADQIHIYPSRDDYVVEIVYYRRLESLTDKDTNWLSEDFPNVYIFGLLVEVNAYVKDADASILWEQRFKSSVDELIMHDQSSRWSGPTMAIQVQK